MEKSGEICGHARRRPRRFAAGFAALLLVLSPAALFGAQREPGDPAAPQPRKPFSFAFRARTALQDLWKESVDAKQERVACLAGRFDGDVFHVTRAQRVPLQLADSVRAAPGPSIDQCGPPEWAGTVHTHIAGIRGRPLLPTFSGSDRAVMGLWRARWHREGVFCVLYTETKAYCEYGTTVSGDARYAEARGTAVSP